MQKISHQNHGNHHHLHSFLYFLKHFYYNFHFQKNVLSQQEVHHHGLYGKPLQNLQAMTLKLLLSTEDTEELDKSFLRSLIGDVLLLLVQKAEYNA